MGGSSSDEVSKSDKKFRIGGGVRTKKQGFSLSDYLAQLGNGNVDSFLPGTMKASTLLELIASERNWKSTLISQDLMILEKNRLFTVSDLRILSKESWKEIELLPIVKDLIRNKISIKEKNKNKNKKKQSSSSSSSDEELRETIEYEADQTSNARNDGVSVKQAKGTIVSLGAKIRVVSQSGKAYEASRYCPHKGVDLAKGWVTDDSLICPKHKWAFNLSHGGSCSSKPGYSINACEINDW